MSKIQASILNEGENLTVVINGKPLMWDKSNPAFPEACKALKEDDWEKLESLADLEKAVENFFYEDGNIKVADGVVYYKDESVHNHTVDIILNFMRKGLKYQPLVKFLDKLMQNPSRRAVNELYSFLEHKQMPITPNGNFLAYKGVRDDYTDWYSGKFANNVGTVLEMPRNGVCDDAEQGCSYGFHAGTYEYAQNYGSGGHLLMVEINPADVVSVPNDCECQKLRTCKYEVKAHCEHKIAEDYCDDYSDDDDDFDNLGDDYDEGYAAGLADGRREKKISEGGSVSLPPKTAKPKRKSQQARDSKGKFC